MKGIYQGNEFDVEGPRCKNIILSCNHNRNSQKIVGTKRGPNGIAQFALHYDHTWFPRDTHCLDIQGSGGNHISDLFSPSVLQRTSCIDGQ